MHKELKILGVLFVSSYCCLGAGIVNPTISSTGGGVTLAQVTNIVNTTAPTNGGITAAQAAVQINDTNVNRIQPVVDGKLAITNAFVAVKNSGGTNETFTNSTMVGTSTYNATFAAPSETTPFILHYDVTGGDGFMIGHGGNEFFLGITNAVTTQRVYIDGNVNGEIEYVERSSSNNFGSLFHRFYVGDTNGNVTNLFEVSTNGALSPRVTSPHFVGNLSQATNMNLSTAQAGTLSTSAADTTWMPITNAIAGTNQPMTPGKALVVLGTNSYGATLVGPTNWPSGGTGSQTPIVQDVDYATFGMTNFGRINMTNSLGQFVLSSNGYMLKSNSLNTTYLRSSTNNGIHLGSNGVDTVNITSTDGQVSAVFGTFGGASQINGASNTLPGTTYMSTNVAPYITADSGTTVYTTNVVYTGKPQRGFLVGSVMLNSGAAGVAQMLLFYTNNGVGYVLNMQQGAGVSTQEFFPFCVPLSTNATFQFSPALGTGASCFVTNTYEWLQ